jgi:hypothetical protein
MSLKKALFGSSAKPEQIESDTEKDIIWITSDNNSIAVQKQKAAD